MAIFLGRLGPDETLAEFGANELGEEYRGLDTRQDRIVAIKRHTLPGS